MAAILTPLFPTSAPGLATTALTLTAINFGAVTVKLIYDTGNAIDDYLAEFDQQILRSINQQDLLFRGVLGPLTSNLVGAANAAEAGDQVKLSFSNGGLLTEATRFIGGYINKVELTTFSGNGTDGPSQLFVGYSPSGTQQWLLDVGAAGGGTLTNAQGSRFDFAFGQFRDVTVNAAGQPVVTLAPLNGGTERTVGLNAAGAISVNMGSYTWVDSVLGSHVTFDGTSFTVSTPTLGNIVFDSAGFASFTAPSGSGGLTTNYDFAAGALTGIGTNANGSGVFSLSSGGSLVIGSNGVGSLTGGSTGSAGSVLVSGTQSYGSGNLTFDFTTNYYGNGGIVSSGGGSGSGYTFNDFMSVDYSIINGYGTSSLFTPSFRDAFNDWATSSYLLNPNATITYPSFNPGSFYDPIGAFYESTSLANDPAPSIAASTPRLLNASGQGVSEYGLSTYDANADNRLYGAELTNLRAWVDANENGIAETGEIKTLANAGITEIRQINYIYYAAGNAVAAPAIVAAPAKPSEAVGIGRFNLAPAVPFSNYRSLRDTDNLYQTSGGYIAWTASDIKINYNSKSYLIGTDGNDAFDINYYAAYDGSYFNLGLIANFLGGNGDDTVGGSTRNDNIWGGAGNDALLGYAGNDNLYGEDGNDELQGQDGHDTLDGGLGADRLFGQVGNDILNGGDGDDTLVGFTASNDAKQTLNAGETDNDYLYGGAGADYIFAGPGDDYADGGTDNDDIVGGVGNDTMFGGSGNDQLQGNEGNDRLAGETGNDRMFGQVGDDTLWGGDGDDVMVGFTATNEAKQTLNAGETDNDTLFGGAGLDDLYGGFGDDMLDGGDGQDRLLGDQGNDTLYGGNAEDELQGGVGNDRLLGEAGNDNMFGQVGDDTLWGGDGDDVMVGFTAANEAKQTLSAGETDNDMMYGGAGNDLMLGGLGNDVLQGDAGSDELQGGSGNDLIYGGAGDDRLFGQVGDDVLYGGDGDDILVGFTGYNEAKQTLSTGETDTNWLYGGAGNDILLGGLGSDYLDGGAGADIMEGGKGDDFYVVNSVNDSILELADEGYDFVVSSANYLLNANIEELRLLEGYNIHGTGNALDNLIIGNSSNNIIDGVTGADMMMGAAGDDTYYVDNLGDETVELAGEGTDTVQSTISVTLADNVENLILLDFAKPEKGLVDGQPALVYGYPKANELDYTQGDAVPDFRGTCALTSIANLLTQAARPTTESNVVNRAIAYGWTVIDPDLPPYVRGGSNYMDQQALLNSYGIRNDLIVGYNEQGVANLIRSGRGVIIAVNAGLLWNDPGYVDGGGVNHAVTVTGAVYGEADGELLGFYIADSGRHKVSDMTRFVDIETFRAAAQVPNSYAIYTKEAIKLWDESIDGTGNALANTLVGNRADNLLIGLGGNDTLDGGAGADTLVGGLGDDTHVVDNAGDVVAENSGEGVDTVLSSIDYTLAANVEILILTGTTAINGDGNADDNVITGNAANNRLTGLAGNDTLNGGAGDDTLDGGAGTDTLIGGLGDDTYLIDNVGDIVTENGGEGIDTVRSSVDYLLGANVENLVLIGTSAFNGTGNSINNRVTGNAANNLLNGGAGADTLIGGLGDDTYTVDNIGDVVIENAGEGTDKVQSSVSYTLGNNTENLTLFGSKAIDGTGNAANNVLIGNSANNTLTGGEGDDTLNGGIGADRLVGGIGNDTYVIDNIDDAVTEIVGEGTDTVQSSIDYTLGGNLENLTLTGSAIINGTGNAANNVLIGNSANNLLTGGEGDDTLNGGTGADRLIGGIGNDTYVIDNIGDVVTEIVGEGIDTVQSSIDYILGGNLENLTLTGSATINGTGNGANNVLIGNSAKNTLTGGEGDDTP